MKPSTKKIDALINAIYCRECSGVQINILDIGKVFAAGHAAFAAGQGEAGIRDAILETVARIRKN